MIFSFSQALHYFQFIPMWQLVLKDETYELYMVFRNMSAAQNVTTLYLNS